MDSAAAILAVIDAPHVVAAVVGVALGVVNFFASRRTTEIASRSKMAVPLMMGGFVVRLALLAAVILLVPREWMHAPTFVLTFMAAFLVSLAFEARAAMRGRRASAIALAWTISLAVSGFAVAGFGVDSALASSPGDEATAGDLEGAGEQPKSGGNKWITDHVYDGTHLDLLHTLGIDFELPKAAGITKHTVFVVLAALITFLILWLAARNIDRVPRGLRLSIEEIVRYFREDFIYPNMGVETGRKFTPFLMTMFLFILIMNLLGMIPFGAAATSNVYVTGTLAVIVFACMLIGGMWKQGPIKFWLNLVPHGVPIVIWPMLFLIELMGLVIKPFALMVRLAANLTAGHIVIFSIMSFIFFFKSWIIAPLPAIVIVLFSLLELLVAFIQAYVFTMLSAVFIGMSLDPDH